MATKKKRLKPKSIAHGRPPTFHKQASLSSKATRTLIRTHHTLEKRKATALEKGDVVSAESISKQIEAHGGIQSYQLASLKGQANDRGGDSSRVLMEWLESATPALAQKAKRGQPLRMLEVGALSTTNACSRSGLFDMKMIDLNSQTKGIEEQDFMERPLPSDDDARFDIISLSLVLNYVPDAAGRGDMLKRSTMFMKRTAAERGQDLEAFFPALFLVLPAPCVTNSRYMDEAKLKAVMQAIGYTLVKSKETLKLVYYLWRLADFQVSKHGAKFKKIELRSGKTRNNFAIVLN